METIQFIVLIFGVFSHGFISRCHGEDCRYRPCENGGICDRRISGGTTCLCKQGFIGNRCELEVHYMTDLCSASITMDTDETWILKSQPSAFQTEINCEIYIKTSRKQQLFVNFIQLDMHSSSSESDYLLVSDGVVSYDYEYFTGYHTDDGSQLQFTSSNSYIALILKAEQHEHALWHSGFWLTVTSFTYSDVCSSSELRCTNGRCISKSLKNNGFNDCGDYSDEPLRTYCSDGYQCADGSCVTSDRPIKCDCNADCFDGSDEWFCSEVCSTTRPTAGYEVQCLPDQFQCVVSSRCIPDSWQCDGTHDCEDLSDEMGCPIFSTTQPRECAADSFRCRYSGICIPSNYRCDKYEDCKDGSDELNCQISNGELIGILCACSFLVVCLFGAVLLVGSALLTKYRRNLRGRATIRTISAVVRPEPPNILSNCDIPPSYAQAVGTEWTDDVKEGIDHQQIDINDVIVCNSNHRPTSDSTQDINLTNYELHDDSDEILLMDSVCKISKTEPPITNSCVA